jgi:hypothetical protein
MRGPRSPFPQWWIRTAAAQVGLTKVEMRDGWTQVGLPAREGRAGWTQVGVTNVENGGWGGPGGVSCGENGGWGDGGTLEKLPGTFSVRGRALAYCAFQGDATGE